jgi:multidrug efflux pump subunit AcrA (membrane-fusion protein)
MDGFIILREKEHGQSVVAGDPILVMADDLIIKADIDETDLKHVKIGSSLKIRLDASFEDEFEGIIEHRAYDSKVVNNVTVYPIHIKPVKKPKEFISGMTATITVRAGLKKDALSIPSEFIDEKADKNTIIVKKGTTKKPIFETREVTTGITGGNFTEIVSGLTLNETVVTFKSTQKR